MKKSKKSKYVVAPDITWPDETPPKSHHTKPNNIKFKIPMQQKIITSNGLVFEYYFEGNKIHWQYLYSLIIE